MYRDALQALCERAEEAFRGIDSITLDIRDEGS